MFTNSALADVEAMQFGFPKLFFVVDCEKRLTGVACSDKLTMVDGKSFVAEEALPWFSTLVRAAADVWKVVSDTDGTARVTFKLAKDSRPSLSVHPVAPESKEFLKSVDKALEQLTSSGALELPRGADSATFELTLTSDLRKLPRDTTIKFPKEYRRGEDGQFITESMKFAPGQPFRIAVLPEMPAKQSPEAADFEKLSTFLPYLSMSCRLINTPASGDRGFKSAAADILRKVKTHWQPPKSAQNDQVRLIAQVSPDGELKQVFASVKAKLRPSDYAALHAIKDAAPFKPFKIPNLESAWVCLDISASPRPEEYEFE